MSDIAIKVENISKKYQIGENKTYPTLRDKLIELPNRVFKGPKKTKEFWALKDVSFEVKKGEVVGIIGRNGAGKSTMLKILARITEPTSGKVTMYGRVASMLEVGTGFNPELTGRENIYLNGAIIGMTKREITQKFDEIVAFSGVEKFLDTPVKHYSSGMYIRLAFAVAAHLDADILLIDEVLAVGDAEFQKKCLGKMSDLAESGRTVVFVSHNIAAVLKLCRESIIIEDSKVLKHGSTRDIITRYLLSGKFNKSTQTLNEGKGNGYYIENIKINKRVNNLNVTQKFNIEISVKINKKIICPGISLIFKDLSDAVVFGSIGNNHSLYGKVVLPGKYTFVCEIPANLLNDITYVIDLLHYDYGYKNDRLIQRALVLKISDSIANRVDFEGIYGGTIRPLFNWKILK